MFQTFGREGSGKVLFTDAIDAMAGEWFSPLIDKEAIFIRRLWGCAVFPDVECEQLRGFRLKLYQSEAVSLAQDGQGVLPGIEVVELEGGDFTGPGP